jgi:outer membrane lipoprotein SlyB
MKRILYLILLAAAGCASTDAVQRPTKLQIAANNYDECIAGAAQSIAPSVSLAEAVTKARTLCSSAMGAVVTAIYGDPKDYDKAAAVGALSAALKERVPDIVTEIRAAMRESTAGKN